MDSQGRGLIKALENWAKKVTKGYRDVDVRDTSVSFRDGLAFCAIIHKYRPDLIDFDSLSKENILENNSLAFSIAEKQLGVPALLDAEDMVKYSRPDRLSIITYLSQLHNCFENQNKVKTAYKRVQNNNVPGPPSKVIAAEPKMMNQLMINKRVEVCQVCSNRVFILERLIVDGKLYHTACFRCYKCNNLLNPGAYIESDVPGKYECSVCLPEEKTNSLETDDTESHSSLEEKDQSSLNSLTGSSNSLQNSVPPKSPFSESVTKARTNFLQHSLSPKLNGTDKVSLPKLQKTSFTSVSLSASSENRDVSNNAVSVKDKISAFESNHISNSHDSKPELPSPIKFRDSPVLNRTSQSELFGNTSPPKPSNRLSLHSSSTPLKSDSLSQNISDDKKLSDPISIDKADGVPEHSSSESLKKLNTDESFNDKFNCDISSESSLSKVTTSDANIPSVQSSSNSLKTLNKDSYKGTDSFRKAFGEYKSPLKASRDIFQTNIQPLKLTIPTISSVNKTESSSLAVSPLVLSADPIISPGIAQMRPSYAKSLTRPLSFSSLPSKGKPGEISESSSSTLLQNKQQVSILPRRRSLGSDKNNESADLQKQDLNFSKTEPNKMLITPPKDSKLKVDDLKKNENLSVEIISNYERVPPVPSVRHSLESKKFELQEDKLSKKSDLQSITSILASSGTTKAELAEKNNEKLSIKGFSEKTVLEPPSTKPPAVPVNETAEESYPDDLNPFGDDGANEEEEYPDDLNPFGDDDDPPKVFEGVCADTYDESKNPFASDEEESESMSFSTPSPKPPFSKNNSPFGTLSSPTGSLHGTTKKRKAPKPPNVQDIFASDSVNGSVKSVKSSPSLSKRNLETPSPKLRKNKPAPPPPPTPSPRQVSSNDETANEKHSKDEDNARIKSDGQGASKELKRRKRPAPPVPIPMRKDKKKIPLKEIMREMKEIEAKQREFEKQGREIELLIRDRDKDEEPSVEEEEYIMQLFDLVNQKNALFRRQAELMYIKRSQRLEEQQEELEKQIRQLMAKPESEKTEEDKTKEEELIYELTDIVDQRNSIIDSIEMDRRRELEEDVSVQEQIEIKNGDLQIAAEIKEKNKSKEKKDKKKKKKDKHQENDESGKSTLKRKLFKKNKPN